MYTAGDIIDFEGKKFIVLTTFNDEGNVYSFINETREDSDDLMDTYYIIKYKEDGSFDKVTDQAEADKIYPKLQEGLKQEMEANGLNVDELAKEMGEE